MSDSVSAKKELRELLAAARDALGPESAALAAVAAQERVCGLDRWRAARTVALYAAFRSETSAALLLERAWSEGKRALLPRCASCGPERRLLEFAPVRSLDELCPGAYGILEPDPQRCAARTDCVPDLLVAPGLGFDRQGYRLGYGGGYYDRYLVRPELSETFCVGLCFGVQLVEALPRDPWDRRLHCICTEKETLCP